MMAKGRQMNTCAAPTVSRDSSTLRIRTRMTSSATAKMMDGTTNGSMRAAAIAPPPRSR